jgi:hypothetical protein
MPFLLIRPDEFDACQDFPLHCLFKLGLGWPTEVGKNSLESVELVELAVAADRPARPFIARPLPVVQSLECAGGHVLMDEPGTEFYANRRGALSPGIGDRPADSIKGRRTRLKTPRT